MWMAAYILLALAASFIIDGYIGEALFSVAASAGFWAFGLWIFRKTKKSNDLRKYTMFCLLALSVFLLGLILLSISEVTAFVVGLVVSAVCLFWGLKHLKRTKGQFPNHINSPDQLMPAAKSENEEVNKTCRCRPSNASTERRARERSCSHGTRRCGVLRKNNRSKGILAIS